MITNQQSGGNMKRALVAAVIAVALTSIPTSARATSHTLTVDGVGYEHTKEAGGSIHWETPDVDPQYAAFLERDQMWSPGDNGTIKLPCPYGIHWISNENVLTISHCLDNPNPTTTTEVMTSTTGLTTTSPTVTTTPTSSTSIVATTTTAPETTSSTSSPETSTSTSAPTSTSTSTTPSTTPSTTSSPTTPSTSSPTTLPAEICTTGVVTDGVCQPVGGCCEPAPTTIAPKLPVTGSGDGVTPWAIIVLCLGGLAALMARRPA